MVGGYRLTARRLGAGIGLAGSLIALVGGTCGAANYPGPFAPPYNWQYRPQEPATGYGVPPTGAQPPWGEQGANPWSPYRGVQPGWGGQPQSPYPQQPQQRPTQPQAEPPRVEVEVANRQPYVQENVVLSVRVISTANLQTATPELPPSNEVLFQKVQEPKAHSRTGAQGRQEIVNEFVYALVPLRPGNLEIAPIRVTGVQTPTGYGRGGSAYDVSSPQGIQLQVRPAMPSVQPWLPLEELTLKATFDRPEKAEEGQPVTLVLQLDAVGGSGTQLPSLEQELQAGDFRVYREQTITDTKLSGDGTRLTGMRADFFTLVPRSGGKLHLPELRVPWWNVKTGIKEHAGLPIRTLQVEGETGPFGLPVGSRLIPAGSAGFWLPIAGLLLLVSGYWIGVWYKGRRLSGKEPLPPALRARLEGVHEALRETLGQALRRLNPRAWVRRAPARMQALLPPSIRFWMCVRQADPEPEPAAWSARIQTLSCGNFRLGERVSLRAMADRIGHLYPTANQDKLRALMRQLDAALYGKQPFDFPQWKRDFRHEVRPRPFSAGLFRLNRWYRRARLPELNPR